MSDDYVLVRREDFEELARVVRGRRYPAIVELISAAGDLVRHAEEDGNRR